MSDYRLETGDCDDRRLPSRMHAPTPPDVLKVEEISLGLFMHHQCSQSLHLPSSPPENTVLSLLSLDSTQGRLPP